MNAVAGGMPLPSLARITVVALLVFVLVRLLAGVHLPPATARKSVEHAACCARRI
jgi:hypothetical protein